MEDSNASSGMCQKYQGQLRKTLECFKSVYLSTCAKERERFWRARDCSLEFDQPAIELLKKYIKAIVPGYSQASISGLFSTS
jgi:hypothetical protein